MGEIERGRQNISLTNIGKIARALKVNRLGAIAHGGSRMRPKGKPALLQKSQWRIATVTLNWMFRNLPSEEITLANYVAINWCGDKRLEDLDAEELAELPEIFEAELPEIFACDHAPAGQTQLELNDNDRSFLSELGIEIPPDERLREQG